MSQSISLTELHFRNLRAKASLQRKLPSPSRSDDSTTLTTSKCSEPTPSVLTPEIFSPSMTNNVEVISEAVAEGPIVTLGHPTSQNSQSTEEKLPITKPTGNADEVDTEADEAFRLCLEALLKNSAKNSKEPNVLMQGSFRSDPNGVLSDAKACSEELVDLGTGKLHRKTADRVGSSSISSCSSSNSSERSRGGSSNKSSGSKPKTRRSSSRKRKRSSNRHRSRSHNKSKAMCSSRLRGRSNSSTKGSSRIDEVSKRRTEMEIDRMKANASLASLVLGARAQPRLPIKTLNQVENVGGLSKQSNQTGTLKNGVNDKVFTLPANLPSQFSAAVLRYLEIFNLSGLDPSNDDDNPEEDKLVKTNDDSNLLSKAICSGSPASEDQKPKLPEPTETGEAPKDVYEDIQGVLNCIGLNLDVTEIRTLSTRRQERSHLSKGSSGCSEGYPECTNTTQSSNHLSQSVGEALENDYAIYKETDVKNFGQQNPSSKKCSSSVHGQQNVDLSLRQQNDCTVLQNSSALVAEEPPVAKMPVLPHHVSNSATTHTPLAYKQSNSGAPPAYPHYVPAPGWSDSPTVPPQFTTPGCSQTLPSHDAGTAITKHPGPDGALSDEQNKELQKQKVIEERLQLRAEYNSIQEKIAFLQKKLANVHKDRGELTHVKHWERSGYKDPTLQEVKRTYDSILHELYVLTKESTLAEEKQLELDTVAKILGVDTGKSGKQFTENKEMSIDMVTQQARSGSQEKPSKRERATSQVNRSRAERSRSNERVKKLERSRSKEKSSSQETAKQAEHSRSHERASRVERSRSHERSSRVERSRSRERASRVERSRSRERASRVERSRSSERASRVERSRSREQASRVERSRSRERASRVERSRSRERASRVERSRSRERASKQGRSRNRDKHTKRQRSKQRSRESGSSSRELSPTSIKDTSPNTESSSVGPLKSRKRLSDSAISSPEPYEYYDAGNYWCRECNTFCGNLLNFFSHMHHKKHQQTLDPDSKPWAEKAQGETTEYSTKTGSKIAVPAKGSEFLIPLSGFYCTLCDEMFCDDTSCEKHVKCYPHNRNYKKYIESNLLYEERRNLDRQAGMAAAIEAKRRRERELKHRLEETHKEDEKHKESTEKNLLKSKTDQQHTPCKRAPFAVSLLETIKLCTANEDLGGRGEIEGTKGSQIQTGKTKPITINIAKKPLPSMQAKIRPDLPTPTMVQRNSGSTNLNKPTPLNTFLSLKSGLTNKRPAASPELVGASNMPKIEVHDFENTEASQKPPVPVVYGYGVKVLNKHNVGTGVAPIKKPLNRNMFPTLFPLLQHEKWITNNSNDLSPSAAVQDPCVTLPEVSTETNQPRSIITQTNISTDSSNTKASSLEIPANFKSVASLNRLEICALRNSQAHSSSAFVFDQKTELLALEGMQQQPSEARTKFNLEASVTLDPLLSCQMLANLDAPEIKNDAQLQGGYISTHAPLLETNYPERKKVATSLTIGLENKLMLGLTPNTLDVSSENVVHRNNHPSQDEEEGHELLDVSNSALAPMQLDERIGSCVVAPEPSEYVKDNVPTPEDVWPLDATHTDWTLVSVEEDFSDSEVEEPVSPEPETPLAVDDLVNETVPSPAPVSQIPDSVDDDPESPDTSEEAAYISD